MGPPVRVLRDEMWAVAARCTFSNDGRCQVSVSAAARARSRARGWPHALTGGCITLQSAPYAQVYTRIIRFAKAMAAATSVRDAATGVRDAASKRRARPLRIRILPRDTLIGGGGRDARRGAPRPRARRPCVVSHTYCTGGGVTRQCST